MTVCPGPTPRPLGAGLQAEYTLAGYVFIRRLAGANIGYLRATRQGRLRLNTILVHLLSDEDNELRDQVS